MSTNYCPSCHRRMPKPRVEKLTVGLCKALEQIHRRAGREWAKIGAYAFKAQHSRLKHWGLLEEQMYTKRDGSQQRRPGVWRVTEAGEEFLAGFSRLPIEAHLEKDKVVAWGDHKATWHEILQLEAPDHDDPKSDYELYMSQADDTFT